MVRSTTERNPRAKCQPVPDLPTLLRGYLVGLTLGALPFVPAFAEDESRYERGERVMLEMMTEVLEQLGPAGLETSLKLVAFNSNSFRQSEENWPALTIVKGTTIRFHYVIPKEADSMAEWLAPPEDPAPDAAALMHEFMCNRPLTRLALENGATILIARYTDLGEALPEIETNLARCSMR